MHYLVAGANSFLGAILCKQLLATNQTVTGLYHQRTDRLLRGMACLPFDRIEAITKPVNVLFIVSAHIPHSKMDQVSPALITGNIRLALDLCDRFRQARIIFCSSVSVYGGTTERPITESTASLGPNAYGLSKLAGELIVRQTSSHAVVRFSSIWGRGMLDSTFLPRVVSQARSGSITVHGDGSRKQNYIHVTDAASYLMRAAESTVNGTFLGVDTKGYSNIEVAQLVARRFPSTIMHVGSDPTPSTEYDNQVTCRALNFRPTRALDADLGDLLAQ